MQQSQQQTSASGIVVALIVFLNTVILEHGLTFNADWYKLAYVTLPLLLLALIIFYKIKHAATYKITCAERFNPMQT